MIYILYHPFNLMILLRVIITITVWYPPTSQHIQYMNNNIADHYSSEHYTHTVELRETRRSTRIQAHTIKTQRRHNTHMHVHRQSAHTHAHTHRQALTHTQSHSHTVTRTHSTHRRGTHTESGGGSEWWIRVCAWVSSHTQTVCNTQHATHTNAIHTNATHKLMPHTHKCHTHKNNTPHTRMPHT